MIMLLLLYIFCLVGLSKTHELEISIDEEKPVGTIIFDLNSLSPSSLKTYQLLETSKLLSFNSTTNRIAISKRIDHDTLCPSDDLCLSCYLNMKLYDMSNHTILSLKFKVNDINDNQPIFSSNTYSVSITENNMPGIKMPLSKAEDIDCSINGVQLYELTYVYNNRILISSIYPFQNISQTQLHNQPFYLMYDSNADLYLVINISLDRELHDEYIFTISVNDNKHTTSTKIVLTVLDVNDHNPKFSQSVYQVNVSNSVPMGTMLLKVAAYDADSDENARISYSLLSIDGYKIDQNEKNDLFHLNSNTGELSLISNLNQIDSKNIFKLIIGASDGTDNAIPALATVYIKIGNDIRNDDESLIQITFGSNHVSKNFTEVYISENLPNATFIAYIKSDRGIKIINIDGFFIQKLTDDSFTLLTDRVYDREKRSSYDVILRNRDVQRTFKIIVTDVNDCKPTWDSSKLEIDIDPLLQADAPIEVLLNATDADENSKVAYRIKPHTSYLPCVSVIFNKLIINYTLQSNETFNDCSYHLKNGQIPLHIEAYDIDNENLSSTVEVYLYRGSIGGYAFRHFPKESLDIFPSIKVEYIPIGIAIVMSFLFVVATILTCIYCRIESNRKPASLMTTITDDNSTKQKIIQISSSEQTSSAGSLYGSEKSDNITVETSDMFLFSPKRSTFLPHPSDNLTNKLFQSIQTDLSLLTENHPPQMISTRGTYV